MPKVHQRSQSIPWHHPRRSRDYLSIVVPRCLTNNLMCQAFPHIQLCLESPSPTVSSWQKASYAPQPQSSARHPKKRPKTFLKRQGSISQPCTSVPQLLCLHTHLGLLYQHLLKDTKEEHIGELNGRQVKGDILQL